MKLHQVICEALDSVQSMPISATQKDKLVATKLRGYLLSINEEYRSNIFERFKNERVFGRPLLNWLLEEEFLYCASIYLDMVVPAGVTSLNNLQFDRSIFLSLIRQHQYHKLDVIPV